MTFTKLFSSITESTIWVAPDAHRICWITMLAMADRKGRVWASIPGLASRARISVENARAAIDSFLSPDPDSRTKEHEGRRIEVIDGGWRLLNHAKYREIRDEEAILEAKRKYINTRRAVENVDRGRHNAEAEAEAKTKALSGEPDLFATFYAAYPRKVARPRAEKAWRKLKLHNGDFDRIMLALLVDKESDQWRRDRGKFIPHPATWLNDRRFEDDRAPADKARLAL